MSMDVGERVSAALAALAAAAAIAAPTAGAAGAGSSGRGYEQVSAQHKNGSDGFVVTFPGVIADAAAFPTLVADDGSAVLYGGNGAFAGASIGNQNAYLARRGSTGWATTAISPPGEALHPRLNGIPLSLDATPQLDRVLFATNHFGNGTVLVPDHYVLAMREADGTVRQVSRGSLGGTTDYPVYYGGMSKDGRHVVFGTGAPIEPGAIDFPNSTSLNLYDHDLATGVTRLVSVLPDGTPDGTPSPTGGELGLPFFVGGNASYIERASRTAVSEDGSRIFFTDAALTERLYVRVDGVRTLEISDVPPGSGSDGATFEGATPDGDHVFFTADAQLTGDAPASGTSLYRYDLNAAGTGGALTFLAGGMDVPGTTGFVGSSDDGQVAYFVSHEALDGAAVPNEPNLYVSNHGTVAFLGQLAAGDRVTVVEDQQTQRAAPQARVTPDGRHLLLQSSAQLDPAFDPAGHAQVYLYDDADGALACVSCGPSPATAGAALTTTDVAAALHPPRNLADDGSWVVFETAESLVARDRNGRIDVYERRDGGAPTLVSSGSGAHDQHLFAVSPDARDVLVSSYERLAASDVDSSGDVYDARIGGGFPLPPKDQPACGGEDCRPAATAPTPGLLPGTEALGILQPTGPRVRIAGRRADGATLVLRVRVSGAGRIAVAGRGLTGARRTVARAGTYRLRVRLTPARKAALARRDRTRALVRARIGFRATGGALTTTTVTATLKA
jgi:hypothetical protein